MGTGTTATSDARIIHPRGANPVAGAQVSTIVVSLKDDSGAAITSNTLTVSVTGPGSLGTGPGAPTDFVPTGHAISVSISSAVPGKYVFGLFADGSGGFAKVEIRDGGTLLATKTAAFYGPVVRLAASQNLHIVNVDGSPLGSGSPHNSGDGTIADTPAVILIARDANGVPVPYENAAEFSAVSSDLSILAPEISVIPDDALGAGSLGVGTYDVQVRSASGVLSGKSATLTFRYTDDGVNYISTAPVTFTTGSSTIRNVVFSFDHAVCSPGDTARLTISALDLWGNPVSDQDAGNLFAFSTGLATSAPIGKMLFPTTTVTFIGGKATTSFNLPTASGLFTVSGRLGTGPNLSSSIQGLLISATATILTQQDMDMAATRTSSIAALDAVRALTALVKAMGVTIAKIMKRLHLKN